MPSVDDQSPSAIPSSPSTPSANRRLLSRIRSPFATKTRNITDFLIEVSDPHRQYSPGDLVTGCVRLKVNKPTRVTHLVVCLHGFVQVFKNPGSPGEGYRTHAQYLANGRSKKSSGEYFGNGFASLFEDEVVLCGDGRLAEGTYQFNFELEFPDRDLPSSIDFERGTISYMITSTLTRPTPITPTMTCDRKVYLVERIDISPLTTPQTHTITLEPLSRRSRARTQARKLVDTSRKTDSQRQSEENRASPLPAAQNSSLGRESVGSASPSEMSLDSVISSNGLANQSESQYLSVGTGASDNSRASTVGKTITASVEMQSGGCLRGDNINVKVHLSHSKAIKSVHGVIVTLYRSARVDMHPAIPLGPTEKGSAGRYEDYYPKSFTGLGGLSLSGAGSSHVFRKDLTQTLAPLYVDPSTLTADVSAKVRVPEGAFPSIASVPGSMISFKYYVEVILDIQGKLGSQDRSIGNLGGLATAQNQLSGLSSVDNEGAALTPFGPPIIDTAQIRRDKAVVVCTFEVIVGTQDSERRKGKTKIDTPVVVEPPPQAPAPQEVDVPPPSPRYAASYGHDDWYDEPDAHYDNYWPAPNLYPYDHRNGYQNGYDHPSDWTGQDHEYHYTPMPIPEMPEESQLSEKERMRRMEERLLPSQPPQVWDAAATSGSGLQASAPYIEEELQALGLHPQSSAPAYEAAAPSDPLPTTNGHLAEPDTTVLHQQEAFVPSLNAVKNDHVPSVPSTAVIEGHSEQTSEVSSGTARLVDSPINRQPTSSPDTTQFSGHVQTNANHEQHAGNAETAGIDEVDSGLPPSYKQDR